MTKRRVLELLGFLILALAYAIRMLPEPDPTITFTCPNHAGSCNDTRAVTFGYLR